jgi:N-acetylmuramoyl-L-alanine amidase
MLTYEPADIDIMARTVYGEIRNGLWPDMVGVAWVIRNRAEIDLKGDNKPDWWGETIRGVCLKPWQFSCWNADDPNLPRLKSVNTMSIPFRNCLAVCAAVLGGLEADPTMRSTHYYNPLVVDEPKWAKGKKPVVRIGAHSFFNDVER